jgi:ABC-2 type transport system ATP-binding protein
VESQLISYKENAFGFNGLIKTSDVKANSPINYGQPSLDDIMIYYANKEELI